MPDERVLFLPHAVRQMVRPDNMNCIYCHGQMKRSKAPFHVDRNGYHLVLDTVPAWVCHQCGEAYFEEREVDAIQSVIKGLDQQARQLVTDT